MISTLPNYTAIQTLYFIFKLKKLTVHFYIGKKFLVDTKAFVLKMSNKNVQKKVDYFEILDQDRVGKNFLELVYLNHLNIDIILGSDVSQEIPISAAVLYTRIDDIAIDYENKSFFEFMDVVSYAGDVLKFQQVQQCRPRMKPIIQRWADEYIQKNNLSHTEAQYLQHIRKLIVKEYFRFFIWFQLSDKYSDTEKIDVNTWIEYNYKLGSRFYQIYYGEE